jgi:hypothetical protein
MLWYEPTGVCLLAADIAAFPPAELANDLTWIFYMSMSYIMYCAGLTIELLAPPLCSLALSLLTMTAF